MTDLTYRETEGLRCGYDTNGRARYVSFVVPNVFKGLRPADNCTPDYWCACGDLAHPLSTSILIIPTGGF